MTSLPQTDSAPPAPPSEVELAKLLVDLVKNQDLVAQKWLEFLVLTQSGLAVALGFLARPQATTSGSVDNAYSRLAADTPLLLIPILGIVFAIALAFIVIRERQWQSYYVRRATALSSIRGRIFPVNKDDAKSPPAGQPWGVISRLVVGLAFVLVSVWVAVLLALWARSAA
jgi:hypothetical protein